MTPGKIGLSESPIITFNAWPLKWTCASTLNRYRGKYYHGNQGTKHVLSY